MFKKTISFFMSILIITLASTYSFGLGWKVDNNGYMSKISNEIFESFEKGADTNLIYIWYPEIDDFVIEKEAYKKCSISLDDIVEADSKMPIISDEVKGEKGEALEKIIYNHLNDTEELRKDLSAKVDKYLTSRREAAKKLYSELNKSYEKICGLTDDEKVYTCQYAPVTIAKLTKEKTIQLAKNDCVQSLELRGDLKPSEDSFYGIPTTNIDYAQSNYSLTGNNIKVGILDSNVVKQHSELNFNNITNLSTNPSNATDHATNVARIIAGTNGVAQNCKIYSIAHSGFESMVETLISYNVSVINVSMGYSDERTNYYNALEQWTDHVANQHRVLIVKSAGNNGNNKIVTAPGLAHNVLTIGSFSTNNTTNIGDDYFETGSRGGNGGQSGCAKPDIISPTEHSLGGGTSMAAPFVTGTIALLFEYKPVLKTYPALTKAVITASCSRKFTESFYSGLTPNEGAGAFNAKRAIQVLAQGRYQYGTYTDSTITKTFSVTSSDTSITVGLSWLRTNVISNTPHNSNNPSIGIYANLKLQVLLPNGNVAGSSNITNSSCEMVHFDVSTYGTYTIKVTRIDSNSNGVPYGLAWW